MSLKGTLQSVSHPQTLLRLLPLLARSLSTDAWCTALLEALAVPSRTPK